MYAPSAFALEDRSEIVGVLRQRAFGHLITHSASTTPALDATAVPFLVDDDLSCVRAHVARANPHWRSAGGAPALLIVPSVDSYVSPRWYPSKREHGRVVPTWNYELVHIHGTIEVHDDDGWKRGLVEDLTDENEATVTAADDAPPWAVVDAPPGFIVRQLKAIVGLELHVTGVQAKRKLSQNRPEADRLGVIDGLRRSTRWGDQRAAEIMRASSTGPLSGEGPR